MAGQNVALKVVITPLLIGGASRAGRTFGHHIGGWLVGLPLTSGPVAFFLATDHGNRFASDAAVGMLAATSSQIGFALAYRAAAQRGILRAFLAGAAVFAATTTALSFLHWSAPATFALVLVTLMVGVAVTRRDPAVTEHHPQAAPRWDVPVRMLAATAVVLLITGLAPVLGAHLAGLLSPFPVFGAVLAVFTHRADGSAAACQVLGGLTLGLFAPAIFFVTLALTLPPIGLAAFALASAAAIATHGLSMLAMPSTQREVLP